MSESATPGLSAQGLQLALGGRRVLDGVDLDLRPGWTAIVGPNGAGKSTLLRAFAGLLTPSAGRVLLGGRPLAEASPRERALRIAWLAQQAEASAEMTVRDAVRLGRLPHLGLFTQPGAADEAAVDAAMAATECSGWQHRRLGALSGGERQRALLARALAVQAPILLLDEPTTHLDPPHQVALVRLLQMLSRTQTVASVLHDLTLALQADRLAVMARGRIEAFGAHDDPQVHAALVRVFGGAVRIERFGDRYIALPDLRLPAAVGAASG